MRFLVETGVVRNEDISIYQYGLNLLIKKIIHVTIILSLGLVVDEVWNILCFLVTYMSIREYSGGYHADSTRGCYFCTVIVTIFALFIIKVVSQTGSIEFWILFIVNGLIIWCLSPQGNKNKPLKTQEKIAYRKKTRKLLATFTIIALLDFAASIKGIVCAWIIQAVMLLISMFQRVSYKDGK